jgi:hypothetical protein
MTSPASTKNGMANKAKLSKPVPILCAIVVAEGITATDTKSVNNLEIPKLHATGTPIPINTIKDNTRITILIYSMMVKLFGFEDGFGY